MTPINALKHQIKKSLRKWGYKVDRTPLTFLEHPKDSELAFSVAETLIEYEMMQQPEAHVVQIGAFDGKSNDFTYELIRKHKVPAVLVEPQKEAFEEMASNYEGQPNLRLENVAISDHDGTLPFYRIKEAYHASFRLAPQLASSDRSHLERALSIKHLKGLPEDRNSCIECIEVPCLTFESLLEKNGITSVSILQIDTEGYDFEIIKMIDFQKNAPTIINFEIIHLSHEELDEATALLFSNGYEMLRYGINMIARKKVKTAVEKNFYAG
jgi:FkbM family methyltransferase